MSANLSLFFYTVSAVCFILALKALSNAKTAKSGNLYGIIGMVIAVLVTLLSDQAHNHIAILAVLAAGGGVGYYVARRIEMTALPQLVAAFHSLVGLAAVFVAAAALNGPDVFLIGVPGQIGAASLFEMGLGSVIGAITFSGSVVAFMKLQGIMNSAPFSIPRKHLVNLVLGAAVLAGVVLFTFTESHGLFWLITIAAGVLGVLLIVPIGGADMPVVISMLNSYSGFAAAGIGFTLNNVLLLVTGALVGASGAILSYIMCKAMNRSLLQVITGGFGSAVPVSAGAQSPVEGTGVSTAAAAQVAEAPQVAALLRQAKSVIIIPGYGMAVAQAQHTLRELADLMAKHGAKVRYAIHPVAGRMPGHMNVLLAEANVPYDDVVEFEEINDDFDKTDVAFIIGANDITNPSAKTDPASPIYGMPVFNVDQAKHVVFVKRSLGAGYAGVDNALFADSKTLMLLGDAKKVCESLVRAFEDGV